jgi:3-phosphoinositide dependent protein kinase-1
MAPEGIEPAAELMMERPGDPSATSSSPLKKTVHDFDFKETLGEGSYSSVIRGLDKSTSTSYAIKILDKRHIVKERKVKYVNIEKAVLQVLRHPLIIRLYYTFQDAQSLYFALELADNGELLTFVRRLGSLSEEVARFYIAEIIVATEYLHSKLILHRDLKVFDSLVGGAEGYHVNFVQRLIHHCGFCLLSSPKMFS